jgi:hypothetical protein
MQVLGQPVDDPRHHLGTSLAGTMGGILDQSRYRIWSTGEIQYITLGNVGASRSNKGSGPLCRLGIAYAETVGRDLHFALRQWTKYPGFVLSTVVVLALGVGVSLMIFRFTDAALLQPLPYASPERRMSVNERNAESPRWPLSFPDHPDWQRPNKSFRPLDIYNGSGYLASELFANSRTGLLRFHSCSRRNKDWCFLICVSISLNAFLQPARTFFPLPVARNVPVGRDNVNASDCSSVL